MRWTLFILSASLFLMINPLIAQELDLDQAVSKSDVSKLPVTLDKIVVRGYDGVSPPPALVAPTRTVFYGYGVTAYYESSDTLQFYEVLKLEAEHKGENGEVLAHFNLTGSRYSDAFKSYFLESIPESERRHIYFKNIYLKDKKGVYFKIEDERPFCPHCN